MAQDDHEQKDNETIRIGSQRLRDFVADVFVRKGVVELDAIQAADVLCSADEWGIRSHGVARLRSYCEMLEDGRIDPRGKPRVVRESAAVVTVDGGNSLGFIAAAFADRLAKDRAGVYGSAWASVFNSNHFGIAGYYASSGAARHLIGIAMTNTSALVSQIGGAARMLGTNPLAVAFPTCNAFPVLVDMATSAISLGVVENAIRNGIKVPPNCIADSYGNPSTDPQALLTGGSLLPLGGSREFGGHKGYCLAVLVDLFCGPLTGASWGPFVPPFRIHAVASDRQVGQGIGHLFGALSIAAFSPLEVYYSQVDDWMRTMQSGRAAAGFERPLIPGEPEHRSSVESALLGTSIDKQVANDLELLAGTLGRQFP